MQKKVYMCLMTAGMVTVLTSCENNLTGNHKTEEKEEISVETSSKGNPVTGFDAAGNRIYGGDPAALVDGDTVYLYTGHDTSTGDSYVIPEWMCYSSNDMENWKYEGTILSCKDISWADKNSAWAGQTIKHYNFSEGKDMYYFYFCSWDSTSEGKQSIGVAVSDNPVSGFTDIGHPLVRGTDTPNESSTWNDIDPTVWIEADEQGEEHRYLCWGNGKNYICELNDDMISVKDLDGDGKITFGTDILEKEVPEEYTEAPWIYRRQDEQGNYYGDYYLFYAYGWREQMAYATTDDLLYGEWKFGGVIMQPTATSNTNHMAVIDFKGKTYFIYHNGSLDGGSGYRRAVSVQELNIRENGIVDALQENAAGLNAKYTMIKNKDGQKLSHAMFVNSSLDSNYPYVNLSLGMDLSSQESDQRWIIRPGKSDSSKKSYVSIESYNKPGLYITAVNKLLKLSQNFNGTMTDTQTFKTVKGLAGEGVSFESISAPGMYITYASGKVLKLTDGSEADKCTFYLEAETKEE